MELPVSAKINGMEVVHEGNVEEHAHKRVLFKNTENTSSAQKYQLLLKSTMNKEDVGKIKIFDFDAANISSYNSDYFYYFRLCARFTITSSSTLNTYVELIDDYSAAGHMINGMTLSCLVETTSTDYIVYIYVKTAETSSQFQVNPNFVKNLDDHYELMLSGDVLTESEFNSFKQGKTEKEIKSRKRFNDGRFDGNLSCTGNFVVNKTSTLTGAVSLGKVDTHIIPNKTGGTNGRDLGSASERFRGCYFSNFIGLPSQSTAGRPTTTSTPPVFDGMTIFDSSLAKIITYWKGNWYANGEIV